MPVTFRDIERADGTAALTDAEKLYVRATVLVFEAASGYAPASTDDVAGALDALGIPERQSLRAHLAKYKSGLIEIDGGTDALKYETRRERWAIRNGVRSLLTSTDVVSLAQEPEPASSDSLQLVSIPLASYSACDEYS